MNKKLVCELCAAAMKQFFPEATEEEQERLLWNATPFPAGEGLDIWWALKEARDVSGGDVEVAIAHAYDQLDRAMDRMHQEEWERLEESRQMEGTSDLS